MELAVPRIPQPRRHAPRWLAAGAPSGEEGVSDIIGSVLTIAITVVMMAAVFFIFVKAAPAPPNAVHADLALTVDPGADRLWGTGDEKILLTHEGGEPLPQGPTTVLFSVGGGPVTSVRGDALDFPSAALVIGQQWNRTVALPPSTLLEVRVVSNDLVILDQSFLSPGAPCLSDTQGPTVGSWLRAPPDASTLTVGPVNVTVILNDNCAGVDLGVVPHLFSRINDGTNPPFTDRGAMASAGGTSFLGSIPDPGWPFQATKTLEYYVSPMRDFSGNWAGSTNQSDFLQVLGSTIFAAAHTDTVGTVASFANLQNDTDAGAEATLSEANTAPAGPLYAVLAANAVVSAGSWTGGTPAGANGFASDNQYATTTTDATTIQYALADRAGSPGSVTQVVLRAEVVISPWTNDVFQLRGCIGATCTTTQTNRSGLGTEGNISYDITSQIDTLHPGATSWSWADVNALNFSLTSSRVAGIDGTWKIDYARVNVTYTPTPTYALDIRMDLNGGLAGTIHDLELQYRLSSSADSVIVQAWDFTNSTWNARATQLTSTSSTSWNGFLTNNEWNGGAPRVRFVDANGSVATQVQLMLDYVRVVTS
jgi:hypothetical protein